MTTDIPMRNVTAFIRKHAAKGPGSWDEPVLRRWLTRRNELGELRLVCNGEEVTAIAAATEQPDRSVHVDLLVAPQWMWRGMLRYLMTRWPDWQARRFTAVRRGKQRTYPLQRLIQRLQIA